MGLKEDKTEFEISFLHKKIDEIEARVTALEKGQTSMNPQDMI